MTGETTCGKARLASTAEGFRGAFPGVSRGALPVAGSNSLSNLVDITPVVTA